MSKPSDSGNKCPVSHLTTQFGAPVPDNQNSLTPARVARCWPRMCGSTRSWPTSCAR